MGAGEAQGTQWDASAIHVVDPAAAYYDTWPATRDGADGFVAWPPPGYIPFEVVYPRWSLFLRGADFSAATVAMQLDGKPVSSSIIYAEASGNRSALPDWKGLVWEPALDLDALERATTHRVDVTIGNVQRSTGPQTYNYTVLLFAPE
jgi:hypothetical protein